MVIEMVRDDLRAIIRGLTGENEVDLEVIREDLATARRALEDLLLETEGPLETEKSLESLRALDTDCSLETEDSSDTDGRGGLRKREPPPPGLRLRLC